MARPRLLLTPDAAKLAFQTFGSIRGAARHLHVARSVVARSLVEARVPLPGRQEAYDAVRFLEGASTLSKVVVRRTRKWGRGEPDDFGVTVIRTVDVVPLVVCVWPKCEDEAKAQGLCRTHLRFVMPTRHRRAGGVCVWPECSQDARPDGRLCYGHNKKLVAA